MRYPLTLLLLAATLALSACDGSDNPRAPATEPAASEPRSDAPTVALATGQLIAFTSYRKARRTSIGWIPRG